MFEEVKKQLVNDPESIQRILEIFGFDKIRIRSTEIRCAFEYGMNPTAIVIRLKDNDNLFVKDYERNVSYDLITYLVKEKCVEFKTVLSIIKEEIGIESFHKFKRPAKLFGGLYDGIKKKKNSTEIKAYPESILDQYEKIPNLRWLRDGISFKTQMKWGVGYDIESQRITLPIRSPYGELMAVKARANFELSEFEPKYLYLYSGAMSQTLFGLSDNYDALYGGDIMVFESEKSVMLLDEWGYKNAVALGSNSLSTAQAKLIMSLNPRSVTFMLDKDLPLENTKRNVDVLREFCKMRTLAINYWNWENNLDLGEKCAACDGSREVFEYILENEIEDIRTIQ